METFQTDISEKEFRKKLREAYKLLNKEQLMDVLVNIYTENYKLNLEEIRFANQKCKKQRELFIKTDEILNLIKTLEDI